MKMNMMRRKKKKRRKKRKKKSEKNKPFQLSNNPFNCNYSNLFLLNCPLVARKLSFHFMSLVNKSHQNQSNQCHTFGKCLHCISGFQSNENWEYKVTCCCH